MKHKTKEQIWEQYKRVLKIAFPLLKFNGDEWNWFEVHIHPPHNYYNFMLINNAFRSTLKRYNYSIDDI